MIIKAKVLYSILILFLNTMKISNIFDELEIPTIEEIIQKYCMPHVVSVEKDCIILGNINCIGSDGQVFESYDKLRVDKDIVRGTDGNHISFTPYNAASHFEKQGMFLPSMALSCNIIKVLYENRKDKEVKKVLMQYSNKCNDYSCHAQNTLVDWDSKKIIHYPCDSDFTSNSGGDNINRSKNRTKLSFNNKGFKNMPLEDTLKIDNFKAFVQDLTGLQQPETMVDIGKHFKKPAHIWISDSSDVRAAWLGCGDDSNDGNFDINANNSLGNYDAARGVRSH